MEHSSDVINSLELTIQSLEKNIEELNSRLKSKEKEGGGFSNISLAELILENSSTILFRRQAADDPKQRKMVYVSPNISCYGYQAKDFLNGKIMFRDIVYSGDSDRTLKEIQDYVEQGVETYSQTYRIVTSSGEVRWIEDRTSVYLDEATGLRYHQGIVIDIDEKKKALQLAAEVQRSLLPESAPVVEGLDIAGGTFPCDEVGGDYYDYIFTPDNEKDSISIVVGDITGHGVEAALLMASARAFLKMRASRPGTAEDIIMAMNRHLTGDMEKTGRFMTLFYLSIERSKNRLRWVRAGHEPLLLYDPKKDRFEELKGPGLALGIDHNYLYQQQVFDSLAKNQVLVLTTDGIIEECNIEGEMFGKERLKNIIRQAAAQDAQNILANVLREHASFTSGVSQSDDNTLVIVKIT